MDKPRPIPAETVAPRGKNSNYPPEFAVKVEGRVKRQLGDAFGLKNFGVNLTRLKPGAMSALHHRHAVQDEFLYILSGRPTVGVGEEEHCMEPGMIIGFPAQGEAHHLRNDTDEDVVYLEIGDRLPGDSGEYPKDDLIAVRENDQWLFKHKDGTPY